MTTATALLAELDSIGVDLVADDGRLRVSAARGMLTDDLRAAIAEHKSELLKLLANGPNRELLPIPKVARNERLPLSFFQERLWIQSRLEPDDTSYNMVAGFESAAPVDLPDVVRAIDAIVRRHEVLLASFKEDGGAPFASFLPPESVPVTIRDLSASSEDEVRDEVFADSERAAHTPFDLRVEPPARFTIYQLPGRVLTVVSAHHIAMDAWSFAILGREIRAAYEGRSLSQRPAFDFFDFAAWQRSALDDRLIERELDWWKKRLAGVPRTSTLPPDFPDARHGVGATRSFAFSRALSDEIRALARAEQATVYMALLAASAALLHWHTGQTDVVLGSPMGLRERVEFEDIVGPFVNLLALRMDLSGDPTFAELIARTRSAVLDAHERRTVPFEKVVEHVNPERSMAHAPICQVAVVQHNASGEGVRIDSGGALFDLTWFVREADGAFVGGFEYRADRYRAETIDQVAVRLEAILRRAVEDRSRRMSELPRTDPAETSPASTGAPHHSNGVSSGGIVGHFRRQLDAHAAELTTDRPRTGGHVRQPARETYRFSEVGLAALVCEGIGPVPTALAALAATLYRHAGQTDFVVGVSADPSGSAPRGSLAAEVLPVRILLDPEAPLTALVRTVNASVEATLGGSESEEARAAAFAQARAELQSPPFAVILAIGAVEPAATPSSGPGDDDAGALRLTLADTGGSTALVVDYDAALFDAATVHRIASHYRAMAGVIVSDPSVLVSRAPLVTPAERAELLARARATFAGPACTTPVVELFARQVERTPDATAVIDDVDRLSYRELDHAVNALAQRLETLGVGPGQHVAVSLERSASVVATLLAILRLGAAYVPVDPHYPPERVAYVLEDSQPTVLVTGSDVRGRIPIPTQVALLVVDPSALHAGDGPAPVARAVDPESIAYVLYTSGSTGRPKGVEISHGALTNFLVSMQHAPALDPSDRLLSVTTISFDIAGLEIFLPLIVGASVRIAPRDVTMDGIRLAELIERSGATVLQATPSTWKMLIETGWRGDPRLKILCGGEAMTRELAQQLLDRAGLVWNMYGPTETTIWSTVHRVERQDGPVPIGKAIDNTAVYVLDPHGEIVPFGVRGELFIGGRGVARGYLRREELTAARFVADPFAGGDARMYRTGDLVRMRPDGTLDCFGRLDHQVKIRGHRIELGEIESVLREHPHVADVVVVARTFGPGDVRLVGYYVPSGAGVTSRELRELCQRKLPREVVPTAWVPLATLPLTPNGKTDTKALPPPDSSLQDDAERVAPRDALETQLVTIWEAVLGTKVASVRDRFFDIGGHSLLAVRLFARVEQATGVALPLATLIEGGTIEHMGASIRELQRTRRTKPDVRNKLVHLVPIRTHGSRPAIFCVHGAGGNVLNFRDIARYMSPDRPFYGVQAAGVDGETRPIETIEEMAERYLAEIRVIQPRGSYYLSGYCGGGIVAYEMAQRLLAAGERVALLVLIDLYRPGSIVLEKTRRRWTRSLTTESFSTLIEMARAKVERDFVRTTGDLLVRYHLLRRHKMPFELRDRWLNHCFELAMASYRLRPYEGKLTVFRARDVKVRHSLGDELGWLPEYARGGVESREVPGDHHTLTLEPNVQVLAAQLEACVRAAESVVANPAATRSEPKAGGVRV